MRIYNAGSMANREATWSSLAAYFVVTLHLPGGGVSLSNKEDGRDGERHDLVTLTLRVGHRRKIQHGGF
jgi:hypothetical protein